MSAHLYMQGVLDIECADDEPVLWIRNRRDWDTVSVNLTPRNIEQLEAAIAEARKYHAMEKVA